MAGGWAQDGAVNEQIEASIADELARLRAQKRPTGESLTHCAECEEEIPEKRRAAISGVKLCVDCQQGRDRRRAQSPLEARAIEMPAVSVRIAKRILFGWYIVSPDAAIGITGRMAFGEERIPQAHVAQQSIGGGGQGFADAVRRLAPAFDQQDSPRRCQVERGCGTGRARTDHCYIDLNHSRGEDLRGID